MSRGSVATVGLADGSQAFHLRYRVGGRRVRRVVHERLDCYCGCGGGWTMSEARAELARIIEQVDAGLWSPPEGLAAQVSSSTTFDEYASDWIQRWKGGEFGSPPSAATIADYEDWRLGQHLLPYFRETPLAKFDRRLCTGFKASKIAQREQVEGERGGRGRTGRPLGNRSITMLNRLLAQILDQAVEDGLITKNPARGKHMRLAPARVPRSFLELDELADVLDTASAIDADATLMASRARELARAGTPPTAIAEALGLTPSAVAQQIAGAGPTSGSRRAVIAGLGFGGLRISELCALEWSSVRLHVGRLDVEDSKTPSGVREVDLTPMLRDELAAYREHLINQGFDVSAQARVYRSDKGKALSADALRRLLQRVRRQANEHREARGLNPISHLTPHTLRRTYISIMLMASRGDVEYVMAQVGHTDHETTMRIYAQLLKRAKRDHGKAFDALVEDGRRRKHGESPA
jgi:integrase